MKIPHFQINLINNIILILFPNQSSKWNWFNYFININKESSNNSSHHLIIFNCANHNQLSDLNLKSNNDSNNIKINIITNANLFTLHDLINQITTKITRCKLTNTKLTCLIIDNFSIFYFNLKKLNFQQYKLIMNQFMCDLYEIKLRYNCNIIITGWNNHFEKGYNYNYNYNMSNRNHENNLTKLSDLTFLPFWFINQFDYTFHYDDKLMSFQNDHWIETLTNSR